MRTRLPAAACLFALSAAAPHALGATYYAAPNGNGNGTIGSPYSLNQATNAAYPGDTVYLRGGNYSGTLRPARSGNPGAWITFAAYPGELPIFNGNGSGGTAVGSGTVQYIRFVGIAARNYSSTGFGNGWTDSNCNQMSNGNLQFINVIADGNGINGIAFYCASGLLIERSIVAHNGNMQPSWSSGVNLFHVTGSPSDNVVRQTVSFENIDISSHRSDGSGFILDQNSSGGTFVNNIGFRNGGSCIRLTNSPNAVIVNNTCFGNGIDSNVQYHDEIFFSDATSRNGAILRNNVAVASNGNDALFGATGVTQQNNLFLNNGAAAPFFTSTSGVLDFNLTAGAAQLVDAGTSTSAPADDIGFDPACIKQQGGQAVSWWQYAVDYDYIRDIGGVANCFNPANRQGSPDIGAYEYAGAIGGGGSGGGGSGAGGTSAGGTSAGGTSAGGASAGGASAGGASAGGASAGGASAGGASAGGASAGGASAGGASAGGAGAGGSGAGFGGLDGGGSGGDGGDAGFGGTIGGAAGGGGFGDGGTSNSAGGSAGASAAGTGTFAGGAAGTPAAGGVAGTPAYGGGGFGGAASGIDEAHSTKPVLADPGCACASAGSHGSSLGSVLAALLGALAAARRRRARAHSGWRNA